MQDEVTTTAERFGAAVDRAAALSNSLSTTHHWQMECVDKQGNVKWVETWDNLVTNVGLDEILDKFWKGSSYTAAHYVGLTDGTPTEAAADTMSSHSGWTEVTAYDESNRQTLTLGSVSSQSVDNSASKASFTISTNSTTVGGAFIVTDNTKGGTSGVLIAVGDFTGGDKSADDGDTLNVTVTLTASSA